jgi:hypothetical protein
MRIRIIGLGLAALLLAGCGDASLSDVLQPAAAQTQPTAEARQLEGTWSGEIDSTNSVSLDIVQDGNKLSGDGIVFENDNPLPVELQGSIDGNSFEISLYPEAPAATEDLLLQGQLTGPTAAQCFLGSQDEFDDRRLTLQRASVQARLDDDSSAGLPQRLTVDFSHPDGPVHAVLTLEDDYFNGSQRVFEGHWESVQPLGPKYFGDPPVQSGFLSGGGIAGKPGWCEFVLWGLADRPAAEVAKFIFRRPQGAGPQFSVPLDSNSWVFRGPIVRDGSEAHQTQKRQYGVGGLSP